MRAESALPGRAERQERSSRSLGASLLDEVLPESLDWRDLVVRYPIPSLLLAAIGGFWLGSHRGRELVEATSTYVEEQVDEQFEQLFERRLE